MAIDSSALNKRCVVCNMPSTDEIYGAEVTVEGFLAEDMAIIRFDEPLSDGSRSKVLVNVCLEEVK